MPHLAILVSYSGAGGVERVINLLAGELAQKVRVDLLTIKQQGPHVDGIPRNVRLIPLTARHAWTASSEIAAYLSSERPDVLLVAKDRAGRAALRAQRRVDSPSRLWLQIHTNMTQSLAGSGRISRAWRLAAMRRIYPLADGIVAVSRGVRDDLIRECRLQPERVHVIHNPAIPRDIEQLAQAPVPHPWLADPERPVIIGMGRLTEQKDFRTLLAGFARLPSPVRLILLGDGEQRAALQRLADELGVAERVLFAGFRKNPYAWLARARLFVLSSRWEGFGNVLAEALALGVPCVSTDCPSGPSEILDGGRFGELVPVADVERLAIAMQETLTRPVDAERLRSAASDFRVEVSAARYLALLGLASSTSA
ncbi:glycosyltransferase [Solimonas terrae]|uniref:Glycosyltransferase n=1 Tax=Solimonas terrae TaxID=1396819 RepID=A0A6M2BSU2_9GAMM|nr:glycosyltransferase [Solimonas terrae]NGY05400.1 glycosyltransferase [Solimonas terrae]